MPAVKKCTVCGSVGGHSHACAVRLAGETACRFSLSGLSLPEATDIYRRAMANNDPLAIMALAAARLADDMTAHSPAHPVIHFARSSVGAIAVHLRQKLKGQK